jgi:hypothetical protein
LVAARDADALGGGADRWGGFEAALRLLENMVVVGN